MGKHIKYFENHVDYTDFSDSSLFILPNLSYCEDTDEVTFKYWKDTRIVAKFYISDITQPTYIMSKDGEPIDDNYYTEIEIDGVVQTNFTNTYTFSTIGEHTVKYTLSDPTIIDDYAFYSCTELTHIIIPDSITKIGIYVFSECSNLTTVIMSNSLITLDTGAFDLCSNLKHLIIPDSVTTINNYAFEYCAKLKNLNIPKSVTTISNSAFYCCNLTSITVNSENTVYDSRDNCNAIIETATNTLVLGCKNTVIPNTVTNIGSNAFENCSNLTNIIIPNSVTTINQNAFYKCKGLTNITIPDSVTTIGNSVFYGCNLTSITVDENNTVYDSRNNCNAIIETSTNKLLYGSNNTVIPNDITAIGEGAFAECTGLTSITIPIGVTNIGYAAYQGCSNLISITSLNPTQPTIYTQTFRDVQRNGTLYIPTGSSYNGWIQNKQFYLGYYNWTIIEQ